METRRTRTVTGLTAWWKPIIRPWSRFNSTDPPTLPPSSTTWPGNPVILILSAQTEGVLLWEATASELGAVCRADCILFPCFRGQDFCCGEASQENIWNFPCVIKRCLSGSLSCERRISNYRLMEMKTSVFICRQFEGMLGHGCFLSYPVMHQSLASHNTIFSTL